MDNYKDMIIDMTETVLELLKRDYKDTESFVRRTKQLVEVISFEADEIQRKYLDKKN